MRAVDSRGVHKRLRDDAMQCSKVWNQCAAKLVGRNAGEQRACTLLPDAVAAAPFQQDLGFAAWAAC